MELSFRHPFLRVKHFENDTGGRRSSISHRSGRFGETAKIDHFDLKSKNITNRRWIGLLESNVFKASKTIAFGTTAVHHIPLTEYRWNRTPYRTDEIQVHPTEINSFSNCFQIVLELFAYHFGPVADPFFFGISSSSSSLSSWLVFPGGAPSAELTESIEAIEQ